MKNIRIFYLIFFIFLVVKFSVYLNGRVFIMLSGPVLTFDMDRQTCGWNFYGPTYSYILQISKYILFHIFVCKKAYYSFTTKRIS